MVETTIIDAHVHLFPSKELGVLSKGDYDIWEYGAKDDVRFSKYNGTIKDTLQAMEKARVEKVVVVHMFDAIFFGSQVLVDYIGKIDEIKNGEPEAIYEMVFWAELFKASNIWVCKVNQKYPQILPFINVDPYILTTNEAVNHIQEMVEHYNVKGVKVHPTWQRFYMHDESMMPIWKTCDELNLPIMAHSGTSRGDKQYGEPNEFAKVLKSLPNLKIILAHIGGGSWRQIPKIIKYPNAYFDICEIIEWTGSQYGPTDSELGRLIKKVGPERVLMGSDFPWYDIDHTVERVNELPHLTKEEKEKILGENAARVLNIQ
ncbi:amidohydrolase family protein [Thermoproteota archaeon]